MKALDEKDKNKKKDAGLCISSAKISGRSGVVHRGVQVLLASLLSVCPAAFHHQQCILNPLLCGPSRVSCCQLCLRCASLCIHASCFYGRSPRILASWLKDMIMRSADVAPATLRHLACPSPYCSSFYLLTLPFCFLHSIRFAGNRKQNQFVNLSKMKRCALC